MATFLLSWLSRRYGTLDANVFLREQPGEWLVMERTSGSADRASEPIAARLALRRDRLRFTLGRDPGSDFIVNDPDVALSHAVLEPDDDGAWTIRRASAETQARLDGLQLGDFPVPLGSGAKLELGGACFTFYGGADFYARLRKAA